MNSFDPLLKKLSEEPSNDLLLRRFVDLLKNSPEEESVMRAHPERSVPIVESLRVIDFFNKTIPAILHHHERIYGAGYPYRLRGDEIPI